MEYVHLEYNINLKNERCVPTFTMITKYVNFMAFNSKRRKSKARVIWRFLLEFSTLIAAILAIAVAIGWI